MEGHWKISWEWGTPKANNNLKESMKLNWNFHRGSGQPQRVWFLNRKGNDFDHFGLKWVVVFAL